jgi:HSP90 family molecular chaperone
VSRLILVLKVWIASVPHAENVKALCAVLIAGLFEMSRDTELGVALYSRRVLIKNKTDNILPKWLRFVKGEFQGDPSALCISATYR